MRKVINVLKSELNVVIKNPDMPNAISRHELEEAIEVLSKHHEASILSNGAWNVTNSDEHIFDRELAQALTNFMKEKGVRSCVDLGCGDGHYTNYFNENGITCHGFDGNPNTSELTKGKCEVLDLSKPFQFSVNADCVISLEVGEHIPKEFEQIYIDNLCKHSDNLIIISWAVPHQEGYGHVNCQTNEYIREQFVNRGFEPMMYAENIIRLTAHNGWFHNTILIFKKK